MSGPASAKAPADIVFYKSFASCHSAKTFENNYIYKSDKLLEAHTNPVPPIVNNGAEPMQDRSLGKGFKRLLTVAISPRFLASLKHFICRQRLALFLTAFVVGQFIGELILWGPSDFFVGFSSLAILLGLVAPRIIIPALTVGLFWSIMLLLPSFLSLSQRPPLSNVYKGSDHISISYRPIIKVTDMRHNKNREEFNDNQRGSQRSQPPTSAYYTGLVEQSPRYRRAGMIELIIRTEEGKRMLCKGADIPWRNASQLVIGDQIRFMGDLKELRPGERLLSYERGLLREGITARCNIEWLAVIDRSGFNGMVSLKKLGASLRERLEKHLLPDPVSIEASGLFFALTLGVRDRVSQETEDAFRTLGLSHLLVLSGYQISLVFGAIYYLARYCISRGLPILVFGPHVAATILGVLAASLLTVISGGEKPALRAVSAVLVSHLASMQGGGRKTADQISLTMLFLIAITQISIIDPSVSLTLAAIIGIAVGNYGSITGRYLWSNWCASAATGLVSIIWFGEWSWGSLVFNPLVAPILGIVPIVVFSIILFVSIFSRRFAQVLSDVFLDFVNLARDEIVEIAHWMPNPADSGIFSSALVCVAIFSVGLARRRAIV